MGKKMCWTIIFFTLAVNVVLLQQTVEAYYGLEYEQVFRNTILGCISVAVTLLALIRWWKLEYKK
ncbi:hypothetical protein [Bacillus taeanensis]|uniref:Uncharacterized protein n=1 Tax=Bacillus taeanensis TaxID=273032 RepID=A0A366XPR9_9BACI|nr:hypothetical protein [Bacillus taeanensis]RBW68360.1 hypothetical protein DS031_16980 [Bacillus taeanensis]